AEALSLAAVSDQRFVGHVLFTVFSGSGADEGRAGALLGPLAVLPDNQKQEIGSALVRAGIEHLRKLGIRQIFVLGDPNYYGRFGFQQERLLMPPYALPERWSAAWQSLTIADAKPLERFRF
ncbi:MAG: N-acetyltransferase, partial [Pseudomonadota bacterium]